MRDQLLLLKMAFQEPLCKCVQIRPKYPCGVNILMDYLKFCGAALKVGLVVMALSLLLIFVDVAISNGHYRSLLNSVIGFGLFIFFSGMVLIVFRRIYEKLADLIRENK